MKDELYHYGVPGMRWGQRKQYQVQGQQTSTQKQPTASKPRPKTQNVTSKPRPKNQQVKKTEQPKKQEQQATEQQSNRYKKGLIAAGVALAIIGTFVIAKKIGQNSAQLPVEKKKVSKGKKAVEKVKNKLVTTKNTIDDTKATFQWLPKPTSNYSNNNKALAKQRTQAAKQLAKTMKKQNPKTNINYNAVNTSNFAKNYAQLMKRK